MNFSQRSTKLTSSPLYVFFRKVKEEEAKGRKIISLGVGEPYYDTPEIIKEAGIAAIRANKTHYNPATGSVILKKAIAEKYNVSIDEVATSNGAKPFLGSVFWSLLNDGDIVYMAAPFYPPFFQIAESCGARVELVDTRNDGLRLTAQALERAIEKNAKHAGNSVIIISSPNNPAGTIYDKIELEKITAMCLKNNITIISDECYNALSPEPTFTMREFSNQVIVINSFSKAYAMTGWRLGYLVCPKDLAQVVGRYLDNYIGCASSISDAAAIEAIKQPAVPDFHEQRQLVHAWLDQEGIAYSPSTGGIFVFPDFRQVMNKKGINTSVDLAAYFLEHAEVATTPGISFGEDFDTYLRISYCVEVNDLKKALSQLSMAIK
ncbi:MAG: aminotransferase class I/II-fold pyridoxal phosphate-dependent enzyme [bacterium]